MLRNQTQSAKLKARKLRQEMSLPEVLLWNKLKRRGIGFRVRRQHPLGIYTLDFFIPEALLCIEIDGGHHEFTVKTDMERDQALSDLGIHTVRFAATSVLNDAVGVAEAIRSIALDRLGT